MIGMGLVSGVVVPAGICKIIAAVSSLMNVKSIEGRDIFGGIERQMEKFSMKDDPMIGRVVKFDDTGYFRISLTAVDQGDRIWWDIHHFGTYSIRIGELIHFSPQDVFPIICSEIFLCDRFLSLIIPCHWGCAFV